MDLVSAVESATGTVILNVCYFTFSASSLYGLPRLKQTEQKREEPSEELAQETEEERAMAAQ